MVPVLSMAISLPLSAGSRDVYLSPNASHKEPENVRERVWLRWKQLFLG